MLLATACSKDEKSLADQLIELKAAVFPEKQDEVIAEEETQRVVGNKVMYLQTVRRQKTLSPVELITPDNLDVIYLGSVLRGGDFLEGSYNPISINNPKEITISVSLQGRRLRVKIKSLPTPSQARQSINNLLRENEANVDSNNTAAYLSYISNEVNTIQGFNKTLGIHANVLSELVTGYFDYTETKLTLKQKTYVLIKVRQMFYNITVDPKSANEWGDLENIGDYEPMYVSSVDYGRVAHLLVETNLDYAETVKTIKAGITAKFAKYGGNIDYDAMNTVTNWFKDEKITILVAGGPLSQSKVVNDLDSFASFLAMPSAVDLVNSATPIGYKVRTLKDNREVEVRTTFTEQQLNLK